MRPLPSLPDRQRVALGYWPHTADGWLFWLRYWAPPTRWLQWVKWQVWSWW
jgi:hypothetical protein